MDFDFLDISKIDPNPDNPRRIDIPTEDYKLSYLKDSIEEFGVLVPVVVTPKDGRFLLIDGERRYHAAKAVGLPKLPAFISTRDDGRSLTKKEFLVRMFQIHHQREPWGPIQECATLEQAFEEISRRKEIRALKDEKARVKAVAEELATKTGIDERTAFDRIKFLRWPEQIKQSVYDDPDHEGYWYICEIEEKIIIPALSNYPEYFKHVSADEVRKDLFGKLKIALARATEVRRVAPFFRAELSKPVDRLKVRSILKKLHTIREMTYEEAEEEFRKEFPNLVRREPPTPRRLLSLLVTLEATLHQFDVSTIETAKRRARATTDELVEAATALRTAVSEFIDHLGG